jgi:prevent-host-death family protein
MSRAKSPPKPTVRRSDTTVIAASEFKARCLEILDRVARDGSEFVITKRGKPVARLSAAAATRAPLAGAMRGQIEILGDIVDFHASDEWEAMR